MTTDRPLSGSPPRVTFLGAAQTVTGSMHLLEVGPRRVLFDCGLYRNRSDDARPRGTTFPFDPATIDAVVLSHAHVDHCGNLPNLVRQGFDGPIFCTPATRDLVRIMLADSARIQEEDAVVSRIASRTDTPPRAPLYTRLDAHQTAGRCVPVPYGVPRAVNEAMELRFLDAGHLLGSAVCVLDVAHAERTHRIVFTGDIGRRGIPFLCEPSAVPAADLLISECTYGGRLHDTLEGMAAKMGDVVRRTLGRGGKVLIPAFSLGRTQLVVHFLQRWMREGVVPRAPLYVDSPLASDIAKVYDDYPDDLRGPVSLAPPAVDYVGSHEESEQVSTQREPCVVVASGGMCDGGRIMQHLRFNIDDPRCAIVLVSYQAPGSVGHQLLEKRPTVRFRGRTWNKWAEVLEINGFSGHADHQDFLALLGGAAGATKKVRLVHGELAAGKALAEGLQSVGFTDVAPPAMGDSVEIG